MIGSQNKELITYEIHNDSNEDPPKCEGSDMGKSTEHEQIINTAKKQTTSKKQRLLSNPDVNRWYQNVARGSMINADVRLRRLRKFCEDHDITPMQLAELGMRDVRTTTDLLQDHVTRMEENGFAPQYVKGVLTSVKSWLRHFDVEIKRKIKIRNIDSTPTLENERVPEGNELAELFNRAKLRQGAIMALIGKAGLRPEVLGNYDATDGLMVKDLPDLAIVQGLAVFTRTPSRIVVRRTLSKARHEYFTFISDLGGKRLLAYMNQRIMEGDALGPESPVIAPSKLTRYRGKNVGRKFIRTLVITRDVRETMRPRFEWRPYVLRAFFDTQLLIAESRGKIAHDFRVFFMGHKGSIEAKYTTNKGILPKLLTDEMRDAFKRSEEFLDLEKSSEDPLEKQKEEVRTKIQTMQPDELASVLELLSGMGGGNTSSESQRQTSLSN
ncbi:MAG: site-specific integrase [Thaumarchaeota archaeon]|nr:site-specific integrase [Nitrososphaerota archaeon]